MITSTRPLVIAHRGASGYRLEHTAAAYRLAVALGADAIEPDLVCTRDGVLVARHENEISGTTDVASRPELAGRRTTKVVDGRRLTGWFVEDLTLAELKGLRAVERLPGVRPANTRYDGLHAVVTLDEILLLVAEEAARTGRRVGVCVELKHVSHLAALGLPVADLLLATLADHGLDRRGAGVVVESFETAPLRHLRERSDLPLVQLLDDHGAPADRRRAGDPTTFADLLTPAGLREVASYADGVSLATSLVLPGEGATDRAGGSGVGPVVADAHRAGLGVWAWTVRAENRYLPAGLRRGQDPDAPGDLEGQVRALLDAGVDGLFTDHPDRALHAVRRWAGDALTPAGSAPRTRRWRRGPDRPTR